nr:CAP domain-containing protein [Cohnella sp. CFH 77786]
MRQVKGWKGWKKWLTVGALTLAVSIPAGAASAASSYGTVQYRVYYVNQGSYFDLNKLLQQYEQYFEIYYPVANPAPSQPVTSKPVVTKPVVTKPVTTKPVTTKPVTTKPVTTQPATKPAPAPANPADSGTTASSFASQVVTLVNQERANAGLKPLATHAKLTEMALAKAKDMKNNNYFDHNSPTYGSPFDMMRSFGITYRYAGENIAMGQRTPQEVMTAWMNSPGHRANILNANYTSIGVAYYNGEWVQEFIG